MVDESTKREIDKVVMKTLKEAGMREPPFLVDDLFEHLEIDREFYDLEDPSLIRRFLHKVKVKGKILSTIKEKIKLAAMWLPNKGRRDSIYVDSSLPEPKRKGPPSMMRHTVSLNGTNHTFSEIQHRHWTQTSKIHLRLRPIMVHLV